MSQPQVPDLSDSQASPAARSPDEAAVRALQRSSRGAAGSSWLSQPYRAPLGPTRSSRGGSGSLPGNLEASRPGLCRFLQAVPERRDTRYPRFRSAKGFDSLQWEDTSGWKVDEQDHRLKLRGRSRRRRLAWRPPSRHSGQSSKARIAQGLCSRGRPPSPQGGSPAPRHPPQALETTRRGQRRDRPGTSPGKEQEPASQV